MHPLDEDHDVVLGLHDGFDVVVDDGQCGDRHVAEIQAAVLQVEGFRVVESALARARRGPRTPAGDGFFRGRWNLAVRRIDDDRRREPAVDLEHLEALVEPDRVVAAGIDIGTLRRRRPIGIAVAHAVLVPAPCALGRALGRRGVDMGRRIGPAAPRVGRQRRDVVASREVRLVGSGAREFLRAGKGRSGDQSRERKEPSPHRSPPSTSAHPHTGTVGKPGPSIPLEVRLATVREATHALDGVLGQAHHRDRRLGPLHGGVEVHVRRAQREHLVGRARRPEGKITTKRSLSKAVRAALRVSRVLARVRSSSRHSTGTMSSANPGQMRIASRLARNVRSDRTRFSAW